MVRRESAPCPDGTECNRELIDYNKKHKALFLEVGSRKGNQDGRKRRTGLQNKKKDKEIRKIKKNEKSKKKKKKIKHKRKKKKNNNKKKKVNKRNDRKKRNGNKRRRMQRSARNSRSKARSCSNRKSLVGLQGKVSWALDRKGKRKVAILASEDCGEKMYLTTESRVSSSLEDPWQGLICAGEIQTPLSSSPLRCLWSPVQQRQRCPLGDRGGIELYCKIGALLMFRRRDSMSWREWPA